MQQISDGYQILCIYQKLFRRGSRDAVRYPGGVRVTRWSLSAKRSPAGTSGGPGRRDGSTSPNRPGTRSDAEPAGATGALGGGVAGGGYSGGESRGGRPGLRIAATWPGSRPLSARARRSRYSIWALVLRSSSAAHRARASWTAGSRRSRMLLRSLTGRACPCLRWAGWPARCIGPRAGWRPWPPCAPRRGSPRSPLPGASGPAGPCRPRLPPHRRRSPTMTTTGELAASVHIDAPPETVFPYFTDPELMVRWVGTTATLAAAHG